MVASQILLIPPATPSRSAAASHVPFRTGGGEDARVVPVEPVPRIKTGDEQVPQRRARPFVQPDLEDTRRSATRDRPAPEAAQDAGILPTSQAAPSFAAQLLGQQTSGPLAGLELLEHRDAAALGSEAYRRAGGEPPFYSEQPAFFRLTV